MANRLRAASGSDLARQRQEMVEHQLRARGISDERLLAAMSEVPREEFVPEQSRAMAYEDRPLPIGAGQTISQPYIVALMISVASVRPDDRVLEVGLGSGYAAAVLSLMAREVLAIDRIAELAAGAGERLARLGYRNVVVKTGDGTRGWSEKAPFDVILAAAGAPKVPDSLREQLAVGGRMVIPVGDSDLQQLILVTRKDEAQFERRDLEPVHFVPLIGEQGWNAGPE